MASSAGSAEWLEQYSAILEAIAARPTDKLLHQQHWDLLAPPELAMERSEAYELCSQHLALTPEQWIEFASLKEQLAAQEEDPAAAYAALEQIYQRALNDWSSVEVMRHLVQFVQRSYYAAQGLSLPPYLVASSSSSDPSEEEEEEDDYDPSLLSALPSRRSTGSTSSSANKKEHFNLFHVRVLHDQILQRASGNLVAGQKVWNLVKSFEIDVLRLALFELSTAGAGAGEQEKEKEKETLIKVAETVFLSRLSTPHSQSDETLQAYSRFVSTFSNSSYSTLLPSAASLRSSASASWEEREKQEDLLRKAGEEEWAFLRYLNWELEVPEPATKRVEGLLKRAVEKHPESEKLWAMAMWFFSEHPPSAEAEEEEEEEGKEALNWAKRALRVIPNNLATWLRYIRLLERFGALEEVIGQAFEQAEELAVDVTALGKEGEEEEQDVKEKVERVVGITLAKAGWLRRGVDRVALVELQDPTSQIDSLISVLQHGIKAISQLPGFKQGEPQLRLEKYLLRMFEKFGRLEQGNKAWSMACRKRQGEAAAWVGKAEYEVRTQQLSAASSTYLTAASKKLDYPEWLLSSWETFEETDGTLEGLEKALEVGAKVKSGVAKRRKEEARKQQQQLEATAARLEEQKMQLDVPTVVVAAVSEEKGKKRAAVEEEKEEHATTSAKKAKVEHVTAAASAAPPPRAVTQAQPQTQALQEGETTSGQENTGPGPLKRDREHCTVTVSGLKAATTEADLRRLFADCGAIREIKLRSVERAGGGVATIEFVERTSVLAARTKDKKRLRLSAPAAPAASDEMEQDEEEEEQEIKVEVAWESTVYTTNFPERYQEEDLKALFAPYGPIFETRWPSQTYKDRRFAYVQYVSSSSAQAAVSALHKKSIEGFELRALISDPERKGQRTDAGANEKELFVAGLRGTISEERFRSMFDKHGTVKSVRIVVDAKGQSKGYAFVEFEDKESAQKALAENNEMINGQHISVTIAKARATGAARPAPKLVGEEKFAAKRERQARSIKLDGIPAGTEEAIVQQGVERALAGLSAEGENGKGRIASVTYKLGEETAVIELKSGADVGKLLLASSSDDSGLIKIDGQALVLTSYDPTPTPATRAPKAASAAPAPGASDELRPRAVGRGRALGGRGRGRLGLGAGRGGRGGAVSSTTASTSAAAAPVAMDTSADAPKGKSQDDFRAFLKK